MDDSTAIYIGRLKQMPRLTAKEEKRLFKKIKEEGDKDAIKKIAKNYLRLLVEIAFRYSGSCKGILEIADLFHEGYNSLLTAAKKFDYENENKCSFHSYATFWVRQAIVFALYNHSRTIRISIPAIQQSNLYYRIENEAIRLEKEISSKEIMGKMGIPAEDTEKLKKTLRLIYEARPAISMESPLRNAKDEGETKVVGDSVSDEKIPNPEGMLQAQRMKEKARKMLLTLTPREEKVLRMRFGIGEKKNHTLGETGDMFSMTRERIRQIQKKALGKLKKKFTIKGNSKFFNLNNYL